jgi:nucleoside-diphosphate-sugar epimerase
MVLVTGATGMVGPRVVEAFAAAGFCVRTFSRDRIEGRPLSAEVEEWSGDVTDANAVQHAVVGADVVVHLAALLHLPDPPLKLQEAYEKVNVQGTRVVVEVAREAGVKRVVFFSTIAVYGEAVGRVLVEEAPVRPRTLYAATKAEAERIVLEARRKDGTPLGVVLRPGSVYGPRLKGNYRRLVEALARRRFVPVGDGRNRRAMVYDRDVASATLLAATHPAAPGRVYNVSDGEEHTLAEIIEAICDALGRRPPRWRVPLRPVRTGVGIVESAARLVRARPPVTRATVDKYTEDMAVDSRRIREELGFVPRYDLRRGWRETVEAMRGAGEI